MVDVVRTPDERFDGLPGWDHPPHYVEVAGHRLAHVDVGAGPTVVLLHGEPTWGYLWRSVVPGLVEAGLRAFVPDQIGFGRSDKPTVRRWFTYDRLVDSFAGHLDAAGIDGPVTLVVHDWGGPVGLRWAVNNPERVARLVILNTALYASGGTPSAAWQQFRSYVESADELPIAQLVQGAATTDLADDVVAGYEAPFHEPAAQAGALALPVIVPVSDDDPGADEMIATLEELGRWEKPTLVIWGEQDPILPRRIGERFARDIPGAQEIIGVDGSHFLQEDSGPRIAQEIAGFIGAT